LVRRGRRAAGRRLGWLHPILQQAEKEGLSSPTKLPGLLSAFGKAMTVDDGGVSLEDWAYAMRAVNPSDLVTIKTNDGKFDSESVPGAGSVELLSSTSMKLLKAAEDDTVSSFLAAHPTWIAADS
jgi:hypothetical protein